MQSSKLDSAISSLIKRASEVEGLLEKNDLSAAERKLNSLKQRTRAVEEDAKSTMSSSNLMSALGSLKKKQQALDERLAFLKTRRVSSSSSLLTSAILPVPVDEVLVDHESFPGDSTLPSFNLSTPLPLPSLRFGDDESVVVRDTEVALLQEKVAMLEHKLASQVKYPVKSPHVHNPPSPPSLERCQRKTSVDAAELTGTVTRLFAPVEPAPMEEKQDEALRNSRMEIVRLQRLLEEEMARASLQRAKLEDELREAKRATRPTPKVLSPTPVPKNRGQQQKQQLQQQQQQQHQPQIQQEQVVSVVSHPTGKYVIAVTGNAACGKTTVCAILGDLGATVIDADAVANQLQKAGTLVASRIAEAFGTSVIDAFGNVLSDELNALLACDANKLSEWDRIFCPAYCEELARLIQSAKSQVVAVEGATVLDYCSADMLNSVWVATADRDTQVARLMSRGLSFADANQFVNDQPSQTNKLARATVVLDTAVSHANLRGQITRAWAVVPGAMASVDKPVARLLSLDTTNPSCELCVGADVTFGRSSECSVQVMDVTVSHKHCRIFHTEEGFFLDCHSDNGTYVNRKKVERNMRLPLRSGDLICLSKAANQSKPFSTNQSFVFQAYADLESRTVRFPSAAKVAGSKTPHYLHKESSEKNKGVPYWINVRTGENVLKEPNK